MTSTWFDFEDLDATEAVTEPQLSQEAASVPTSTVASELLAQPLVAMAEASVTPQPELAPAVGAGHGATSDEPVYRHI